MESVLRNIEFDAVCTQVTKFVQSEIVADNIRQFKPTSDLVLINKALNQTKDAFEYLVKHKPVLAFDNIEPIIDKAKVGATLTPSELLKVGNSINVLENLKKGLAAADGFETLKDIVLCAIVCDELNAAINQTIDNETSLKDTASDKLYKIRKALLRANSSLRDKLNGYTRQSDVSKYLQDNIVTVRDGRYVLPVKAEYRSHIGGLVHDVSASGATLFIEPFAVVEANNEIKTLKTEEIIEIERILHDLSGKVSVNSERLIMGQDILIECGIIFAKAEYAKSIDAYMPKVNDSGKINIIAARHPLIDSNKIVPVDISLLDKRVMVISGPNTGGKTVALKTVGLFSVMAACGMFVPAAEGSELSVFDELYCDIGDSQSISQSLSTFSAHINNIAKITGVMNSRSLVLLDEVGDGTDPESGAALAIGIIKRIIDVGATAIVTTHFDSVKEFALADNNIINACMQFDHTSLKPTYKLIQGIAGSSYALEIAENLGLDNRIITDAKAALSSEKRTLDEIMKGLEALRYDAEKSKELYDALVIDATEKLRKADELKSEYEAKLSEITANSKRLIRQKVDEYDEYAEEIIENVKAELKSLDMTAVLNAKKLAKQLSRDLNDEQIISHASVPADEKSLSQGTEVFVSGLDKKGVVVNKPKNGKVIVAIGAIKTELPIDSISVIAEKHSRNDVKIMPNYKKNSMEPENKEVMMLSLNVDEAVSILERILDDIPPHSILRIVHGKGTGALGRGIQQFLKRQPRVKSYRYGRYGEGDTGVTIVEIK